MGDILVGAHNDSKSGFLGNFVGPVISGPGYDSAKAIRQLLLLEPAKSWEHITKVFKQLMPMPTPLALTLNTLFLRSLGDLSGSPHSKAMKRAYMREIGSKYYAR